MPQVIFELQRAGSMEENLRIVPDQWTDYVLFLLHKTVEIFCWNLTLNLLYRFSKNDFLSMESIAFNGLINVKKII